MDGPHTLEARWLRLNYAIPLAIVVLLGFVLVLRIAQGKEKRASGIVQGEKGETWTYSPEQTVTLERRFNNETARQPDFIVCRYCGAKIPRGLAKCPECGLAVRYMGAG